MFEETGTEQRTGSSHKYSHMQSYQIFKCSQNVHLESNEFCSRNKKCPIETYNIYPC